MSRTSTGIIGYFVHLILIFVVTWLIFSAITAWIHPHYYTQSGGVNWWTSAWVSFILIIFFLIITWIIYWIFSSMMGPHKDDVVCYKQADPCSPQGLQGLQGPQPVMCLQQTACPPKPKTPEPTPYCASVQFAPPGQGWKKSPMQMPAQHELFYEKDKRESMMVGDMRQ